MDAINFDHLRLFLRIAALGSLSAVAGERNVPVSQVSRALKRMEKSAGACLVHRTTHGLSLTPEGQSFLEYCHRICVTADAMEAEFSDKRGTVSGLVRISVSSVVAQYVVVPLLPGLQQQHPHLTIELIVEDQRVDMARTGIDIAIRTGEPLRDTVVMHSLGQFTTQLYASPAYLQQAGVPASLEQLPQHRLLSNCAHPILNTWRFKEGRTLIVDGNLRADNTAVLLAMCLQGMGITQLPSLIANPFVQQGFLVPVLATESVASVLPVNAVMLAERHRLPKIQACIQHLVQGFSQRGA